MSQILDDLAEADVDSDCLAEFAIDEISVASRQWHRENRRPPALTHREALQLLRFEALLVMVAAANQATGLELTEDDRQRLNLAAERIEQVVTEVIR